MIGYIRQPFLGGMFAPKVNVMDREGGQEIATVQAEAKCCIGGMVSFALPTHPHTHTHIIYFEL